MFFCACFMSVTLLELKPHYIISDFVSFRATASLRRLEFQHGFSLPVPQLESVCGGVCTAVCLCSGSSHFYAWEPPLLPGGKRQTQCIGMLAAPFPLLMVLIMTFQDSREYKNLWGIQFWCRWSCWFCIYYRYIRKYVNISGSASLPECRGFQTVRHLPRGCGIIKGGACKGWCEGGQETNKGKLVIGVWLLIWLLTNTVSS